MPAGDVPVWRRIRRRLYWLLTLLLLQLADLLPIETGRRVCRALARLAVRLRRSDVRRAQANLQVAFPELDIAQRDQLLAASVEALGTNFFDTLAAHRLLKSSGRAGPRVTEAPCVLTGGQPVAHVIAELGRPGHGVLLLCGHIGCWEVLGGYLAQQLAQISRLPLAVVTGTVHNQPVNELLQRRRARLGLKVLPRQDGATELLRHLRAGGVVAILLDQNTQAQSLVVPFFGRPAPTPSGIGKIAMRYGLPVLPVGIQRTGREHVVSHLPPVMPQAYDKQDLAEFLATCNLQLETMIRRNPAEWVWFHKRWSSSEPQIDKNVPY